MNLDRRTFLGNTAKICGSVAASSWAATSIAQENSGVRQTLPIIDTHQHLWDLDRFQPPWLADAPQVIRSTHATKEYLEAAKELNIVKSVYMEIDVAPEQHMDEAKHVITLSQDAQHPTVAAVISGRPASEQFAEYIRPLSKSPFIKGVRQVLHVESAPAKFCLGAQFIESMKLLGDLNLSYDLCMRPGELDDGAVLAQKCQGTRFIIDHCGNADPKAFQPNHADNGAQHDAKQWRDSISRLAEIENVVCKISGIVARVPTDWDAETLAPIVNHCLDSFGDDRVVFGSDWPVCKLGASLRQWVIALREIISNRPIESQRKLLHDNAERLYRI